MKRARTIAAAAVVDTDFTWNTITREEWLRQQDTHADVHIVLTEGDR